MNGGSFGGLARSSATKRYFLFHGSPNSAGLTKIAGIKMDRERRDEEMLLAPTCGWDGESLTLLAAFSAEWEMGGGPVAPGRYWRIRARGDTTQHEQFMPLQYLSRAKSDSAIAKSFWDPIGKTLDGSYFRNPQGKGWIYVGDLWVGKVNAYGPGPMHPLLSRPTATVSICSNTPPDLGARDTNARRVFRPFTSQRAVVQGTNGVLYAISVAGNRQQQFLVVRSVDSSNCIFRKITTEEAEQLPDRFWGADPFHKPKGT